jgi:hypothetical protein
MQAANAQQGIGSNLSLETRQNHAGGQPARQQPRRESVMPQAIERARHPVDRVWTRDEKLGILPEERGVLSAHERATHLLREENLDEIAAKRAAFFFKPVHGFASRGVLTSAQFGRGRLRPLSSRPSRQKLIPPRYPPSWFYAIDEKTRRSLVHRPQSTDLSLHSSRSYLAPRQFRRLFRPRRTRPDARISDQDQGFSGPLWTAPFAIQTPRKGAGLKIRMRKAMSCSSLQAAGRGPMLPLNWASPVELRGTGGVSTRVDVPLGTPSRSHTSVPVTSVIGPGVPIGRSGKPKRFDDPTANTKPLCRRGPEVDEPSLAARHDASKSERIVDVDTWGACPQPPEVYRFGPQAGSLVAEPDVPRNRNFSSATRSHPS